MNSEKNITTTATPITTTTTTTAVRNTRTAYWTGRKFSSRQIGIRAHIQFLKRSASANLDNPRVLPMQIWNGLDRVAGTRKTLESISRSWGIGYVRYANQIKEKYEKLFAYVSVRRR